jgi:C_GCAxxG_C_C family probable redox protein
MTKSDIEQKAFGLYQSGKFHCAEAIATVIVEAYAGEPYPGVTKAAAGFCGGIGRSHKETCGALTGGVIAIGQLYGRTAPGGDIEDAAALSAEFRQRFTDRFGSSTCEVLLQGFDERGDAEGCYKLTGAAAGLLSELLDERADLIGD